MDKFIIEGGARLKGEVAVSGAKNAALPVLVSTILTKDELLIKNVPKLKDIDTVAKLLQGLGTRIENKDGTMALRTPSIESFEAPYDLVKTMRASVLLLGPLLARYGKARVSMPGGCAIGARPINLHLDGLKKLGVKIDLNEGYIDARVDRLRGSRVYFDIPTVTGTMNIMMAASLAQGDSRLENCAREPEVIEVAKVLRNMGARIEGEGTSVIEIHGVGSLKGTEHSIIPDRIETGTYMAAAVITKGEMLIKNTVPLHVEAVTEKFRETGAQIEVSENSIKVIGPKTIESVDVSTAPYPGFPTDMQAQFMAVMTVAEGSSVITENIFEARFMHAAELRRMGADITTKGSSCIVKGVKRLNGAPLTATDLRASASLVLAALACEGRTEIRRIYHLDRGYEKMETKLKRLGAKVSREKDSKM